MFRSKNLNTKVMGNKISSILMLFAILFSNVVAAFSPSLPVIAAGNDAIDVATSVENLGYDPSLAAPGPEPASKGYAIAPQDAFAARNTTTHVAGPITVDANSSESGTSLSPLFSLAASAPPSSYGFSGGLEIVPITAYNLIVDSNVLAPSSYGPNAATLGAQFCNRSGSTMNDVWGYIGSYNGGSGSQPGVYPINSPATNSNFNTDFPHLAGTITAVDYGDPSRFLALEHESGSTVDASDASRYIGTLAAGECRTMYWLVSYPRVATVDGSRVDVTGGVKPEDDLWLQYDFWARTGATTSYYTRYVTMRNEISAMANKIWPNGDNKVPDEYVNAIAQVLGWDTITPSGGSTAYPGETVTSQGIWYDFGVIGAGFDNNYDLVPDRNAWVQPIGDAGNYDPGCFRLVRTYGLVIVKLNDGTELLIPFVDQMYFENIPSNNTGVVGLVFYEYAALDGACVAGLTPYQEVASGFDNEKFNADFGAGIPPLQSRETNMTLDKSGPGTVSLTGTMTYTMTFTLPDVDTGNASTTVIVGSPSLGTPLTFYDAVPVGLQYVSGSASSSVTMTNYTSGSVAATRLYSTDGGTTWSTTDPGNYTSSSTANQLVIQWRLAEGITSPATGPAVTGAVSFQAVVPNTYTSTIVNNTACLKLGNAECFVEDTHSTLVNGTYSITGNVFCDDGPSIGGSPCNTGSTAGVSGSGWRENGSDEPGMGNISVSLYYDTNNNNAVDSGDTLLSTTTSTRYNVIDGYIDIDNSGTITAADDGTLNGYAIIDGAVDIVASGTITTADDGTFAGFTVIDGRLDTNRSGTVDATDDGTIAPYYFSNLPGNTNYVVVVDTDDTDIPTGYTNTTPSTRSADIAASNVTDVDFAFAPALTLVKRLDSPAVTIVGQTAAVQYTLRITNNIPGSGGPTSFCTYTIWASEAHVTTGDNPDGGGPANAQFQNPNNSLGAPDDLLATTVMLDNTDTIGLTGFNTADLGGNITKVETIVYIRETLNLDDDRVILRPYYDNAQLGTDIIYPATYFSSPVGTEYVLVDDITSRRPSWTWSDFQPIATDNETRTELQVEGDRIGGTSGDIGLDAVAYRITTDQVCNDPSQIINPLPLTDTYESDYLTFISANPPVSSSSVSSGTGTLTWDNLGPLYPGQTKEIIVTFYAAAITNTGDNDADNTASITDAKFGNGRDTNDVTDNTPVVIIDDREIHGRVWYDTDGDGWQGSVGYEDPNPDEWIPNVEVALWVCELADGTYADDDGTPNIGGNDTCADLAGQWVQIATDVTDINGQYDFTGLFPGYYIVKVNTSTLPSGATQTADPNDLVNLCGTCDHQMGLETEDLQDGTIINLDVNAADLSADDINFGYDYTAGVFGKIWEDVDNDPNNSPKETTDNALSGVTVQLYNSTCTTLIASDTTDVNGNYFFGGLTAGTTYCVQVLTSTLPAGSTWTEMSELNNGTPDASINNTITFTAATNTNTGSLDYGWRRSGTRRIGDTLFYDWDGDGTQDAGVDEGIPNITVSLYTDADNDGLVEAGDFLVNTTSTFPYPVIDGQLDINFDGSITAADNGTFASYTVIAGRLDINGGGVDGTDDGTANGVAVIDGYLDIDGDGITSADSGDDIAIGQYVFNNLSSRGYVVVVDTADAQFPPNVSQTKDPDESGVCSVCDSRSKVTYTEISTDGDGFVDTEDFGYYPFSSGRIGDLVWQDNNGDGLRGITEPALAGVTVLLQVDLNGDGTYSTIRTTTTNSSGLYLFSNLPLGTQYNYRAVVELSPANNAIIPNDGLGNEYTHSTGTLVDSTTDYVYINATITSGSPTYLTADFGFAPPASFGDTVYQDINNNGTQDFNEPGINGVTVRLYTFTDLGDGDGVYDLGEPFYDENGNSTWDAGEPFFDQDGRYQPGDTLGTLVATTTTATVNSAAGKYQFAGLTPGYYVAVVDTSSAPLVGATLTGDPATDGISCTTLTALSSPPSSVCDSRDGTRLYNATNYTGADFGYLLPGAIGDTLWIDTDNDGVRDLTEAGIANVTVYLCDSSDTLPCNAGNANATTVTDANGNYSFTGLSNNTYYVAVDTTDTDLTSLGLTQTYETNSGTPDNTTTVVVNSSGSVTSINGTACTSCNLNIDFGYRYQGNTTLSGTVCLETTVNGVCGDTTTDTSGVGAGETAYNNVTVFLYRLIDTNSNGLLDAGETTILVATTATNSSGDYSFTNIVDGVYYIVAIGAPQSGLDLTSTQGTVNSGGDDSSTSQYVETTAFDGSTLSAYQVVNTSGDTNVTDRDFAFNIDGAYDFGDLPASYSTTLAGNPDGARHEIPSTPTLYFGAPGETQSNLVDLDGVPTTDASGDGSDEDGVFINTALAENADGWSDGQGVMTFNIVGSGWLIAWMDFDGDGQFSDANEMVINQAVTSGQGQTINITPPASFTGTNVAGTNYLYSRFRLFTSQPSLPNLAFSGVASGGEVEDYRFPIPSSGVVTPVTLSYFRAYRYGGSVNFEWSTLTETANLGFNLYVETGNGGLIQINKDLIPSNTTDSLTRQDYKYSLNVGGNVFYIEDISLLGEIQKHGPFQLGKKYGGHAVEEKVNQAAVIAEHLKKTNEQQKKLKNRLNTPASALKTSILDILRPARFLLDTTLNIKVNQTGVHRVTYEQLVAAGLDLKGVPVTKITLLNKGNAVPIFVQGSSDKKLGGKFGPGAYMEFYGEALDTIYTDTNVYTLQVSTRSSVRIPSVNAAPGRKTTPAKSYLDTVTVNNQRAYANYAPGNDAWYDTAMLVSSPKSWDFPFQVTGLISSSAMPQTLELVVWGATDYVNTDPDHHLLVSVNGVPVADERFDGFVEHTIKVSLPAGTLHEGTNTIQLTLPKDTGEKYDLINLDKFSVTYPRSFTAKDGTLTFTSSEKAFTVTDLPGKDVVVYRITDGRVAQLNKVNVTASNGTYTASFSGTGKEATYIVTTSQLLHAPKLEATRAKADLNRQAQYLIISHPDFIDGLAPLIAARQAQGFTVSVVDVNDLYMQYTYGIFDPSAIKQYIAHARKNLGAQYVLLVGGDTYDYRNYLGINNISFIPSLYISTDPITSKFVPVDPLYADVDNDNVPDLSIGRFPVRSQADLKLIVDKTLAYTNKDYERTAVFASDLYDGIVSYKALSNSVSATLPPDWTYQSIHMDNMPITTAQQQLISAMNSGTALVTYTGHSAPTLWSFSRLFTATQARSLTNTGRPFVTVQWGCFNTYYVDPVNNTFVQSLLFAGDRGAAAIMGASTRTDSESEEKLGLLLTPRLVTPGTSIGSAMLDAKRELAVEHPELLDVILGWTLMGDPALVIQP